MITIQQLLESVDLDFEARFVTKNKNGYIYIWSIKPCRSGNSWTCYGRTTEYVSYNNLKLADFENKPWQECIYEVPRKTTGKIEKLLEQKLTIGKTKYEYPTHAMLVDKINKLVDYVNALIESNNIHEKQIDKLQMKLEPEKCAVNELKGAKNEQFNLEKINR